jgi:hypothetical protein
MLLDCRPVLAAVLLASFWQPFDICHYCFVDCDSTPAISSSALCAEIRAQRAQTRVIRIVIVVVSASYIAVASAAANTCGDDLAVCVAGPVFWIFISRPPVGGMVGCWT